MAAEAAATCFIVVLTFVFLSVSCASYEDDDDGNIFDPSDHNDFYEGDQGIYLPETVDNIDDHVNNEYDSPYFNEEEEEEEIKRHKAKELKVNKKNVKKSKRATSSKFANSPYKQMKKHSLGASTIIQQNQKNVKINLKQDFTKVKPSNQVPSKTIKKISDHVDSRNIKQQPPDTINNESLNIKKQIKKEIVNDKQINSIIDGKGSVQILEKEEKTNKDTFKSNDFVEEKREDVIESRKHENKNDVKETPSVLENKSPEVVKETTAGVQIRMSNIFDPDPTVNNAIQSKFFQDMRRTQIIDYIDSHFKGQKLDNEVLDMIDNLITSNLRGDLRKPDSRLSRLMKDEKEHQQITKDKIVKQELENSVTNEEVPPHLQQQHEENPAQHEEKKLKNFDDTPEILQEKLIYENQYKQEQEKVKLKGQENGVHEEQTIESNKEQEKQLQDHQEFLQKQYKQALSEQPNAPRKENNVQEQQINQEMEKQPIENINILKNNISYPEQTTNKPKRKNMMKQAVAGMVHNQLHKQNNNQKLEYNEKENKIHETLKIKDQNINDNNEEDKEADEGNSNDSKYIVSSDDQENSPIIKSNEQVENIEPVARNKQIETYVTVTSNEQVKNIEPIPRNEQVENIEPVQRNKQVETNVPVTNNEQVKNIDPVTNNEQFKTNKPVANNKQVKNIDPVTKNEQVETNVPVTYNEQVETNVPVANNEQVKNIDPVTNNEQVESDEPISHDKEKIVKEQQQLNPTENIKDNKEKDTAETGGFLTGIFNYFSEADSNEAIEIYNATEMEKEERILETDFPESAEDPSINSKDDEHFTNSEENKEFENIEEHPSVSDSSSKKEISESIKSTTISDSYSEAGNNKIFIRSIDEKDQDLHEIKESSSSESKATIISPHSTSPTPTTNTKQLIPSVKPTSETIKTLEQLSYKNNQIEVDQLSSSIFKESVDIDHEKLKYTKKGNSESHLSTNDNAKKTVDFSFLSDDDPLKTLCTQHPTLQACKNILKQKSVLDDAATSENESNVKLNEGAKTVVTNSTASYIKAFTRWMNGNIYSFFVMVVEAIRSLVIILFRFSFGFILSFISSQTNEKIMLKLAALSVEWFASAVLLIVNHVVFYWYFKNSSYGPIVKVVERKCSSGPLISQDEMDVLNEKIENFEKQLSEKIKKEHQLIKKINQLEAENADSLSKSEKLESVVKQEKGTRKAVEESIKRLRESKLECEEQLSDKEAEIKVANQSIHVSHQEHDTTKAELKKMEEKFFFVIKELDTKDVKMMKMTENEKEIEKQLEEKQETITELEDILCKNSKIRDEISDEKEALNVRLEEENKKIQLLETEIQVLQESILTNTAEAGSGDVENENDKNEVEQIKADRLSRIMDSTKVQAELKQTLEKLNTYKEDLSKITEEYEENQTLFEVMKSNYEKLNVQNEETNKLLEKKEIELSTIRTFFGDRENDYQKTNVVNTEEIKSLQKQLLSLGDSEGQVSILMKRIEELREEIVSNERQYKQQVSTCEEQAHSNYIKMRAAIRECDEHKREKEIYRKRLLDIDVSPQFKKAVTPISKTTSDRVPSPANSNKSGDENSSATDSPKPASGGPSLSHHNAMFSSYQNPRFGMGPPPPPHPMVGFPGTPLPPRPPFIPSIHQMTMPPRPPNMPPGMALRPPFGMGQSQLPGGPPRPPFAMNQQLGEQRYPQAYNSFNSSNGRPTPPPDHMQSTPNVSLNNTPGKN